MSISISQMKIDTKTSTVAYPDHPEFKLELAYVSREKFRKLYSDNQISKLNDAGYPVEELDSEKFSSDFVSHAIRGWKGLTIDMLADILLIDTSGHELSEEVPFSLDNAMEMFKGSTKFERWVTEAVKDLSKFRTTKS